MDTLTIPLAATKETFHELLEILSARLDDLALIKTALVSSRHSAEYANRIAHLRNLRLQVTTALEVMDGT